VAEARGLRVVSPDYSDLASPEERVERLLGLCEGLGRPLALVGSSMGAYVSLVASARVNPVGLFLMAPAVFIPGYREQEPAACADRTVIVQGWNDEIIPASHVIRFARGCRAQLHLVDSDHRLEDQVPFLTALFGLLLEEIAPHG
jgi:pimeloyl-ACP methyl ester carboxylesterase